jgi:hypothetical protein
VFRWLSLSTGDLDLKNQEVAALRSQIATLNTGRGAHRKYRPLAFTEHGAVMAATILTVRELRR